MGLPYLPKLHILRYLPEDDLEKMRRTSSSMLLFIDQNRGNLVERTICGIQIREIIQSNLLIYEVAVRQSKITPVKRFYVPTNILQPNLGKSVQSEENANVEILEPVKILEWTAKRLLSVRIEQLQFKDFHFDDEESDEFALCLRRRKVRLVEVTFVNSLHSRENLLKLLRFVRVLQLKNVTIREIDDLAPYILETKEFWETVAELSKLELRFPTPRHSLLLPPEFHKFPATLNMSHGVVVRIESMKKAIHAWWKDELKLEMWCTSIPRTNIVSIMSIVTAIDLPFQSRTNCELVYRNPQGKQCEMRCFDDDTYVRLHTIGVEFRNL